MLLNKEKCQKVMQWYVLAHWEKEDERFENWDAVSLGHSETEDLSDIDDIEDDEEEYEHELLRCCKHLKLLKKSGHLELVKFLCESATVRKCEEGESIVEEGAPRDAAILVRKGKFLLKLASDESLSSGGENNVGGLKKNEKNKLGSSRMYHSFPDKSGGGSHSSSRVEWGTVGSGTVGSSSIDNRIDNSSSADSTGNEGGDKAVVANGTADCHENRCSSNPGEEKDSKNLVPGEVVAAAVAANPNDVRTSSDSNPSSGWKRLGGSSSEHEHRASSAPWIEEDPNAKNSAIVKDVDASSSSTAQQLQEQHLQDEVLLGPEDTIASLLFTIGALTNGIEGNIAHTSSVYCVEPGSEVFVISDSTLKEAFYKFPKGMLLVNRFLVQRLLSVTGTFHRYFGLRPELFTTPRPECFSDANIGFSDRKKSLKWDVDAYGEFEKLYEKSSWKDFEAVQAAFEKIPKETLQKTVAARFGLTSHELVDGNALEIVVLTSHNGYSGPPQDHDDDFFSLPRKEQSDVSTAKSAESGAEESSTTKVPFTKRKRISFNAEEEPSIDGVHQIYTSEMYPKEGGSDLYILLSGEMDALPRPRAKPAAGGSSENLNRNAGQRGIQTNLHTNGGFAATPSSSPEKNRKNGKVRASTMFREVKDMDRIFNSFLKNRFAHDVYEKERALFSIKNCGELLGHVSVLAGMPQVVFYKCRSPTAVVLKIKATQVQKLCNEYPRELCLNLLQSMVPYTSPTLRRVEAALDWFEIPGGQTCYSKEEPSDGGFYLVLSGALRLIDDPTGLAVTKTSMGKQRGDMLRKYSDFGGDGHHSSSSSDNDTNKKSFLQGFFDNNIIGRARSKEYQRTTFSLVEQHGDVRLEDRKNAGRTVRRGGFAGCVEAFARNPYRYTAVAVRDTEVCRINRSLLKLLNQEHPRAILHFMSYVLSQYNTPFSNKGAASLEDSMSGRHHHGNGDHKSFFPWQTQLDNVTKHTAKLARELIREQSSSTGPNSSAKFDSEGGVPNRSLSGSNERRSALEKQVRRSPKGPSAQGSPKLSPKLASRDASPRSSATQSPEGAVDAAAKSKLAAAAAQRPASSSKETIVKPKNLTDLKTICFVPATQEMKTTVGYALKDSISLIHRCAVINGFHEITKGAHALIGRALQEMENEFDVVLYVADPTPGEWSKFCLRQADLVLVGVRVSKTDRTPNPVRGSTESFALRNTPPHIPVEVLLVHSQGKRIQRFPSNAGKFLPSSNKGDPSGGSPNKDTRRSHSLEPMRSPREGGVLHSDETPTTDASGGTLGASGSSSSSRTNLSSGSPANVRFRARSADAAVTNSEPNSPIAARESRKRQLEETPERGDASEIVAGTLSGSKEEDSENQPRRRWSTSTPNTNLDAENQRREAKRQKLEERKKFLENLKEDLKRKDFKQLGSRMRQGAGEWGERMRKEATTLMNENLDRAVDRDKLMKIYRKADMQATEMLSGMDSGYDRRYSFASRRDVVAPGLRNFMKERFEENFVDTVLEEEDDDLRAPNFSTRHYLRPRLVQLRKWREGKGFRAWHHATETDLTRDLDRFARILFNKAIALVLGGGGAKGIAHVGVIQAMHELGIPIDIVCGTSMGSFVGGSYAMTPQPSAFTKKIKSF